LLGVQNQFLFIKKKAQ